MHARALCHATENVESVKSAVQNTVGETDFEVTRTSGHHGNEILVIEAHLRGGKCGIELLDKLSPSDKDEVLDTLERRMDESCNLFLRVDKQRAFLGELTLAQNDDAVAIRMKVAAFPAKRETALRAIRDFLSAAEG
ncbi:MAG TPA: RNA-binding domain-containing protein [Thermoplasmata archaeon]|nr:RNA-binding domain-containing protein [Thermoplasmata archaeon]